MVVQELAPADRGEWEAYVDAHPQSTCYHDLAWQGVAESAYRLRTRFLVARLGDSGPIVGALPLFRVRGLVRAHLTNGLFGAYASVLAHDDAIRLALIERARKVLAEEGLSYLLLKTSDKLSAELASGFGHWDAWVTAELRLDGNPDRMWKGFRDKIRNCVRKGIRNGLEARWGTQELDGFYEVLAENMHQKGSPIYGFEFMRELVMRFGARASVLTLRKGEAVAAGALVLRHKDKLYVPFASSQPSLLATCPNNLLYWEVIRKGCLEGARSLDFGRSMRDSGPLAFKLGWGAEARDQPCYVLATGGRELSLDPRERGVGWFVRQWKRLPRPVADVLGPPICRQLAGLL